MEAGILENKRFVFVSHDDFNLYRFRLPIMKALVSTGAEVWAVALPGEFKDQFAEHGIRFHPWELDRRTLNPFTGLSAVRSLRRIVERLRPDVVHAFTLRPILYAGFALSRLGVRLMASITGLGSLYLEEGIKWRIIRKGSEFLFKKAFLRVDGVIFQNRDDRDYFVSRGLIPVEKAYLIRGSGVDVERFSPGAVPEEERTALRYRYGIPEDAVVVVMVARLIRFKGVYEFVEVARRFRYSGVRFVLVGSPDPGNPSSLSEEEVEVLRREGSIVLPGFQKDVRPWLSVADVYVLPSYYREGLPLSVLEAMAMGLPVVTTDVPGCRETVEEGVNGFLVPPRDVEALEKAIRTLMEDPELRRRMGEASRRKAEEEFSLDMVLRAYLELYDRIMAEAG